MPRRPPPPGPGRPKGSRNKATAEIRDAARRLLADEKYVESLKYRLMAGKAQHMEVLLHHYAYGKPSETIDIGVPEGVTIRHVFAVATERTR